MFKCYPLRAKIYKYMAGTALFKSCVAGKDLFSSKKQKQQQKRTENKTSARHSHGDGGELEVSDPAAPPRCTSTRPASLRANDCQAVPRSDSVTPKIPSRCTDHPRERHTLCAHALPILSSGRRHVVVLSVHMLRRKKKKNKNDE